MSGAGGFFVGYGLIAIAVAITLNSAPHKENEPDGGRFVAVALWPLAVYAIVNEDSAP